jgi:alcohol dehydrogenase (NADP+)
MGSIAADYKFEGWQALDASAAEGNMVWQEFKPKAWEENDIDVCHGTRVCAAGSD